MNIIIGQTLLDQFRVVSFVASGGMGAVYKVWDVRRNVSLAMKMLHAELAEDPSIFKRFEREARALQRLAHPNIVPFYGLYKTDEFAFLLEQYVDGPTLKHVLKQQNGKPLPIQQSLIYLKALSAALGYAHANGVVHCDVKPGNVMIDRGGIIYLTDFGIARHAESTTTTLSVAGTAAYMAPEQCRAEPVTAQTDVYALGVILYEMLTGSRPFQGGEREAETSGATAGERIRYAHVHLMPPNPRQINPALSTTLANAMLKALAKEPTARYRDARAMYEAICAAAQADPDMVPDRAVLAASLFGAPPETPVRNTVQETYKTSAPTVEPTPSSLRNRRQTGTLLVGVLALVAIAAVTVVALSGGTPRTPTPASPTIASAPTATTIVATEVQGPIPNPPTITSLPDPSKPPPSPTVEVITPPVTPNSSCQERYTAAKRIAFARGETNSSSVYVSYDGRSAAELIRLGTGSSEPDFSPDGNQLVMQVRSNNVNTLYLVDVQTGSATQLTRSSAGARDPHWSPDGCQIVFARGNAAVDGELRTIDLASGSEKSLNLFGRSPVWSPDGKRLAYMSDVGGWRIFVVDLTTQSSIQLPCSRAHCRFPRWSPDGSTIAYNSIEPDYSPNGLWLVSADGQNNRELTSGRDGRPDWWDANTLIFNRGDPSELCLIDISSGSTNCIINTGGNDWAPNVIGK